MPAPGSTPKKAKEANGHRTTLPGACFKCGKAGYWVKKKKLPFTKIPKLNHKKFSQEESYKAVPGTEEILQQLKAPAILPENQGQFPASTPGNSQPPETLDPGDPTPSGLCHTRVEFSLSLFG